LDDRAHFLGRPRCTMASAPGRVLGDALNAQIEKSPTPQRDGLAPHTDGGGNLFVLKPVASQQDHPRTLREANAGSLGIGDGTQLVLLNIGENNRSSDT